MSGVLQNPFPIKILMMDSKPPPVCRLIT